MEGQVFFTLFNKYIELNSDDSANIAYVELCARNLNELSSPVIDHLCQSSINYCNDFLRLVGEKERNFSDIREVLSLINPCTLLVPAPLNINEPIVHLELYCEWEVEHGMEWIVRADKVMYVGALNGENVWADYSVRESWNYA